MTEWLHFRSFGYFLLNIGSWFKQIVASDTWDHLRSLEVGEGVEPPMMLKPRILQAILLSWIWMPTTSYSARFAGLLDQPGDIQRSSSCYGKDVCILESLPRMDESWMTYIEWILNEYWMILFKSQCDVQFDRQSLLKNSHDWGGRLPSTLTLKVVRVPAVTVSEIKADDPKCRVWKWGRKDKALLKSWRYVYIAHGGPQWCRTYKIDETYIFLRRIWWVICQFLGVSQVVWTI